MESNSSSIDNNIQDGGDDFDHISTDACDAPIVELESDIEADQSAHPLIIEEKIQFQNDPKVYSYYYSRSNMADEQEAELSPKDVDSVKPGESMDGESLEYDDKDSDTPKSERRNRKQKTPIKMRVVDDKSVTSPVENESEMRLNENESVKRLVDDESRMRHIENESEVRLVENESVNRRMADNTIGIFHNGGNVPPLPEASVEAFISHFVIKQDAIGEYGLFEGKKSKKRGAKKTQQIFQCTQCNKTFNYKCNLQMHAAVHSNEKTHVCSICNKSFKLKGHLDTHRKVHEERYEYKCDICGKEFKLKGNIKTHIRTKHLDERMHQCTHCDMSFKLKQHLSNHLRIKHGIS